MLLNRYWRNIHKMPKRKVICPKCKSDNVSSDSNVLVAFGVPQKWKCKDCAFTSFIFPEIEKINNNKKHKKTKK